MKVLSKKRDTVSQLFRSLYALRGIEERMGPLWIWKTLNVQEFLGLLNAKSASDLAFAKIPQHNPTAHFRDRQEIFNVLRECVDEWLDSGYRGEIDEPRMRRFTPHSELANQIFQFCRKGKLVLLPDQTKQALTLDLSEDERSDWLPDIVLVRRYLTYMMLSDLRLRLAKCRTADCGRYFLLKRPSKYYKRGTRCEKCVIESRAAAAANLTAESRDAAKEMLIGLTARKFSKRIQRDTRWHRDAVFKQAIAEYLNERIAKDHELKRIYLKKPRNGVKSTWVTRNQRAIESAVKRRKAAK